MSINKIDEKTLSVINNGGSIYVCMPNDWLAMAGLKKPDGTIVDKASVALARGKHGFFLSVYNKEFQQKD